MHARGACEPVLTSTTLPSMSAAWSREAGWLQGRCFSRRATGRSPTTGGMRGAGPKMPVLPRHPNRRQTHRKGDRRFSSRLGRQCGRARGLRDERQRWTARFRRSNGGVSPNRATPKPLRRVVTPGVEFIYGGPAGDGSSPTTPAGPGEPAIAGIQHTIVLKDNGELVELQFGDGGPVRQGTYATVAGGRSVTGYQTKDGIQHTIVLKDNGELVELQFGDGGPVRQGHLRHRRRRQLPHGLPDQGRHPAHHRPQATASSSSCSSAMAGRFARAPTPTSRAAAR